MSIPTIPTLARFAREVGTPKAGALLPTLLRSGRYTPFIKPQVRGKKTLDALISTSSRLSSNHQSNLISYLSSVIRNSRPAIAQERGSGKRTDPRAVRK